MSATLKHHSFTFDPLAADTKDTTLVPAPKAGRLQRVVGFRVKTGPVEGASEGFLRAWLALVTPDGEVLGAFTVQNTNPDDSLGWSLGDDTETNLQRVQTFGDAYQIVASAGIRLQVGFYNLTNAAQTQGARIDVVVVEDYDA